MLWELLASALLGLTAAGAAVRRYPGRFHHQRLTLVTGPGAAFFGGLLTYAVLGSGHTAVVLTMGMLVSGVLLSLLVHPTPAAGHGRTARLTG